MSADQFVGTWQLLSLEARTSAGDVSYPFGKDASGYLLYSREGYMSASVMQARRAHFASPDAVQASADEKVAAFDSYSSYSGRYEVRGQKIIHQVEISSFPNWSGKAQERFFAFSGDQLMLTAPPMCIGGVELTLSAHLAAYRVRSTCRDTLQHILLVGHLSRSTAILTTWPTRCRIFGRRSRT